MEQRDIVAKGGNSQPSGVPETIVVYGIWLDRGLGVVIRQRRMDQSICLVSWFLRRVNLFRPIQTRKAP